MEFPHLCIMFMHIGLVVNLMVLEIYESRYGGEGKQGGKCYYHTFLPFISSDKGEGRIFFTFFRFIQRSGLGVSNLLLC